MYKKGLYHYGLKGQLWRFHKMNYSFDVFFMFMPIVHNINGKLLLISYNHSQGTKTSSSTQRHTPYSIYQELNLLSRAHKQIESQLQEDL